MDGKYTEYLILIAWLVFIGVIFYFLFERNGLGSTQLPVMSSSSECKTCSIVENMSLQQFQLSSVGIKRALLIGLNYSFPGSICVEYDCELFGCIQDVKNIQEILLNQGYLKSNITFFVDDLTTEMPNKNVILRELNRHVELMNSGDTLFVWYSGHGSQKTNVHADGGYNECWCPPDTIANSNYITDDELNYILKQAPSNTTIFVGSDSCHSGTVLDLKYIATNENKFESNRQIELVRGRQNKILNSKLSSNKETIKNLSLTLTSSKGNVLKLVNDSEFLETSSCIVSLSGCQDYDVSTDAFLSGKSQGAMTWAFCSTFNDSITLSDLLINMRTLLKRSGFAQIPQMTFGQIVNPNVTTVKQILFPLGP
jgi:hypothetical protein